MIDPFHVVYLTGAPATGKSTLVSTLMQSVQPLEGLSYSKLLANYLTQRQQNLVEEDQLRKQSAQLITPEDVNAVDEWLIDYVGKKRIETHIIIDSHPVTKEQYGYRITAFPVEKLRVLRPTMICVLYTEPEIVIERIRTNNQGRPTVSLFEANFHSELQAAVAATYGILLGVPVYLFDSSRTQEELINEVIMRLEAKNSLTRRIIGV